MKKLKTLLAGLLALSLLLCGCAGGTGAEERPLSLGHVTDGVYRNDYLDLSFSGEGWDIMAAEDIPQTPAKLMNAREGRELREAMAGMPGVLALMAIAPDQQTNVNIAYSLAHGEQKAMDREQFLDAFLESTDDLAAFYTDEGLEVSSVEVCNETFAGEQRRVIQILSEINGEDACMLQIIEKPYADVNAVITITTTDPDRAFDILGQFDKPSLQTAN